MSEHRYAVRLEWSGAASGPTKTYAGYSRDHMIAAPGKPPLPGSADPAFRGDASKYNPEELLLAALSACHMLSYLALCAREGIGIASYSDNAVAVMAEKGGAGRFTSATLCPVVEIDDERVERATALHEEAHAQCFIANSVNFPVEHEATTRRVFSAMNS